MDILAICIIGGALAMIPLMLLVRHLVIGD
ncbi:Region of a membrane-bound protein predicted to be embedded in the membrane [Methanobacterium congolense]|jgi:hypothetical protein|uniref:Region of a membrane-bound protein predicted to be embedded in the membrane n=1 Tax=Methanobacterium congolense TaxID=118062 RepID=A0A1D3L0C6_9EURY|nr:Region of a membrane-bound protein predicted to be embedded in the membrane [Methanobacterium congolense]